MYRSQNWTTFHYAHLCCPHPGQSQIISHLSYHKISYCNYWINYCIDYLQLVSLLVPLLSVIYFQHCSRMICHSSVQNSSMVFYLTQSESQRPCSDPQRFACFDYWTTPHPTPTPVITLTSSSFFLVLPQSCLSLCCSLNTLGTLPFQSLRPSVAI